MENFSLYLPLLFTLALLLVTYAIGSVIERRHFADIRRREAALHGFPVISFEELPDDWRVDRCGLVSGNVVISLDYFKRFLAALRSLVGGRVKSYEPLLDRARREALLRMSEAARAKGFDAVVNVRLETARLASSRGDGKGTAGIEILAFGTAIQRV